MLVKNPITRLSVTGVELSNGVKFDIVHNLSNEKWEKLFNKWLKKARRHTAQTLIAYIKERVDCICVTKEQYDIVTHGKVVHATKEEYEAENN